MKLNEKKNHLISYSSLKYLREAVVRTYKAIWVIVFGHKL